MDQLSRQAQRIERDLGVTAETLTLFVRFCLTITPPFPGDAQTAARIKGRERFEGSVEKLGKRLQKGQSFLREIPDDVLPEIRADDATNGENLACGTRWEWQETPRGGSSFDPRAITFGPLQTPGTSASGRAGWQPTN